MRWTKMIVVAALALGAAPAMADGGTRTQGMTAERMAAHRAERARLAEGLPFVAELAPSDAWDLAYLTSAGDLDGDGAGDLVDLRTRLTFDDTLGDRETVRIDALRGRDGAALWSVSVPTASYVYPVPAKVGVDGKPGVVVVSYDDVNRWENEGGGGLYRTTVTSYDRTGKLLWATELDGADVFGAPPGDAFGYGGGYGDVDGFFDAVAGGGTDMLVRVLTYAGAYDPTGAVEETPSVAQFAVLDGATGTLRPLGSPVAGQWGSARGFAVGDLDKDTLDDVVVELDTETGVSLTGLSTAATGKTLWTLADAGDGFQEYLPLPDVTGDGTADFAIQMESWGVPVPSSPSIASHEMSQRITLVDGAKGKVAWRKTGTRVFAIGNADRKAGAEVVLGEYLWGSANGIRATAWTGTGKKVWSVTRTLPSGRDGYSTFRLVGDVGSDGVLEVGYGVASGNGSKKMRYDQGTIDGRTGRVKRDPKPRLLGSGTALDGKGADSYETAMAGGVLTVAAWSGSTAARLWSVGVKTPGFVYTTFAAPLDADKCADVTVGLWTEESSFTNVVYSGSTGKPLWMLTRSGDALGKVSKPAARSHKVYRKGC